MPYTHSQKKIGTHALLEIYRAHFYAAIGMVEERHTGPYNFPFTAGPKDIARIIHVSENMTHETQYIQVK